MATRTITASGAPPLAIARPNGGWHATEWTLCTFDRWARVIGVTNSGTGSVFVSRGLSGTRATTEDQDEVRPGSTKNFRFGQSTKDADPITLSIFGADGASHVIGFILERDP
jgi:hypothetical protein